MKVEALKFNTVTEALIYILDNYFLEDLEMSAHTTHVVEKVTRLQQELYEAVSDELWGIYNADIDVAASYRTRHIGRLGFTQGLYRALSAPDIPFWEDEFPDPPKHEDYKAPQHYIDLFKSKTDSDHQDVILDEIERLIQNADIDFHRLAYRRGVQVGEAFRRMMDNGGVIPV